MTEEEKRQSDEVREKADRLAELAAQQEALKKEADAIKAWFEARATDDLKDTKSKTVEYWGSRNAKVTVGMSSTVKPVSLTMMFLGEYTEGSLDETIRGITGDEKIQRVLRKKLKGKYGRDTETLVKLAGLPEKEASDWAYLVAEVVNWEWIVQVLKAAGWGGTPQEAIDIINSAIIVDEGLKVSVEAERTE